MPVGVGTLECRISDEMRYAFLYLYCSIAFEWVEVYELRANVLDDQCRGVVTNACQRVVGADVGLVERDTLSPSLVISVEGVLETSLRLCFALYTPIAEMVKWCMGHEMFYASRSAPFLLVGWG